MLAEVLRFCCIPFSFLIKKPSKLLHELLSYYVKSKPWFPSRDLFYSFLLKFIAQANGETVRMIFLLSGVYFACQ